MTPITDTLCRVDLTGTETAIEQVVQALDGIHSIAWVTTIDQSGPSPLGTCRASGLVMAEPSQSRDITGEN